MLRSDFSNPKQYTAIATDKTDMIMFMKRMKIFDKFSNTLAIIGIGKLNNATGVTLLRRLEKYVLSDKEIIGRIIYSLSK